METPDLKNLDPVLQRLLKQRAINRPLKAKATTLLDAPKLPTYIKEKRYKRQSMRNRMKSVREAKDKQRIASSSPSLLALSSSFKANLSRKQSRFSHHILKIRKPKNPASCSLALDTSFPLKRLQRTRTLSQPDTIFEDSHFFNF